MHLLESALKFMVLPPASLLLLYLAGVLAGRFWRRPRLGACLRHGAVGLLFLLSTGVGSWLLARPLESLEVPMAIVPTNAQAIVVLTAGRVKRNPEYGNLAMPDFIALERMTYAAMLARQSGLPLLTSGGSLSGRPDDIPLASSMQRVFSASYGMPVRWIEAMSLTTAENASMSAPILKNNGIRRIILVTDAMHMHRARLQFERTGLIVTPAPTFFTASGTFSLVNLLPTAENLRRSYYAVYEWLALLRDKALKQ